MRQGREARDGGDIPGAQDSPDSFLSCRPVGMSYMSCGRVLCLPPQPGSTVVLGITPSLLARGALEIPNSYSTAAQGTVCQWWGGKGHRSPSSGLYILSRITDLLQFSWCFFPQWHSTIFFFLPRTCDFLPCFCLFVLSFCCCLNWHRNFCLILSLLVFFPNVLGENIHCFTSS